MISLRPVWHTQVVADPAKGHQIGFASHTAMAQSWCQILTFCTRRIDVCPQCYPSLLMWPGQFLAGPHLGPNSRRNHADTSGLTFDLVGDAANLHLIRNVVGGRATCRNQNFWSEWFCWLHCLPVCNRAVATARKVALMPTALHWVRSVVQRLARSQTTTSPNPPSSAVSAARLRATPACATDLIAFRPVAGRGNIRFKSHRGSNASVAFSFC